MNDLLTKIEKYCQEYTMLPSGCTVFACVSGGVDSMALLELLKILSKKLDFSLRAAHFNHRLRGEESDSDEAFVREYCQKLAVPLSVGSASVTEEAARRRTGIEETARSLRYDFFQRVTEPFPDVRIATAHTADDNLETLLLRLVRGAGLCGLCGIPPVRGNIIRPLLTTTRAELEEFNSQHGVPHREDSSNASDEYARNKLRHLVVPVLRELNPNVAARTAMSAELMRRDEEYLSGLAERFVNEQALNGTVAAVDLLSLPYSVASRVVRRLREGLSAEQVNAVLSLAGNKSPSARVSLPGGDVRREYGLLIFSEETISSFAPFTLEPGATVDVNDLGLRFSAVVLEGVSEIYKSFTTFLFKFEAVCGKIIVRPRIIGDFIRLSENSGSKSLKKLFIDKKIPRQKRESVPVICDESGPIAVMGLGSDIRVRPERSDRVIKVKIEEITK